MNIRIVVLNYNGEKILGRCMPSIVQAAKNTKYEVTVTVLDNCSTDKSVELIRKNYPSVTLYEAPENRVLCSYNEYLARISEPYVILLNNDIKVSPNFIDALIRPFELDQDVFMVTSKCLAFQGLAYDGGRCRSEIRWGLFWNASRFPGYESKIDQPDNTMAAGFGAFDRKKFLELGGYDDLYLPGRLEDNDICFSAWRRGWKCLYEPHSVIFHLGAVSFGERFGSKQTLILGHRNSFLFLWKNIRDPLFLLEHVVLIVPRLLVALLMGKGEIVAGFFQALPRLGKALKKRRETRSERPLVSDKQIFNYVK